MYLVADIGNTRVKYSAFSDSENIKVEFLEFEKFEKEIFNLIRHFKIQKGLISSVKSLENKWIEALQKLGVEMLDKQALPLTNLYSTPETLGRDRISCAVGAGSEFKNQNVLVIDAGTCIKYDFVNSSSAYLGGGISPGLQMRFKALHTFTDKLPLIHFDIESEKVELIGNSTESSILSGVLHGTLGEVRSMIEEYQTRFSLLSIIITGGDADFFVKHLKSNIFARPNLAIKGLAEILIYNETHFKKN